MFLNEIGGASAESLYVVFTGGIYVRDALTSQDLSLVGCALSSITSNLMRLIDAGARTFLVANVPNLGQVPAVALLWGDVPAVATGASYLFNQELEKILSVIEAAYDGQVRFYRLDTFGLITQASINHPELNIADPCIDRLDAPAIQEVNILCAIRTGSHDLTRDYAAAVWLRPRCLAS